MAALQWSQMSAAVQSSATILQNLANFSLGEVVPSNGVVTSDRIHFARQSFHLRTKVAALHFERVAGNCFVATSVAVVNVVVVIIDVIDAAEASLI